MDLSSLTNGRASLPAPQAATGALVEAQIATTPAGRENVDVLIGGEQSQRTSDCSWTPVVIDGSEFTPARGDPCFIQQARKGEMVVVWWEPGDDRAGEPIVTGGQAADWIDVTFAGSWSSFTGATSYRKDAIGNVHLRGLVTGGASTTAVFTLPAGYRPGQGMNFSTNTAGGPGSTTMAGSISIAGVVTLFFGAGTAFSLDGITFLAEN